MRALISLYDVPERQAAIDAWWAGLTRHWRALGLSDIPATAHMPSNLYKLWLAPDLFIAQTCGYPLTHELKDRVTLIATPVYAVEGCAGGRYHSVIIARADSGVRTL